MRYIIYMRLIYEPSVVGSLVGTNYVDINRTYPKQGT